MGFARGLGRFLLSIAVSLSLSLWLVVATLQLTVLNHTTVKDWFSSSDFYNNIIPAIPFDIPDQDGNPKTKPLITSDDLHQALGQTLPASFLQSQAEAIIDSAYDWLEGSAQQIEFSIPLNQKRAEFQANLATIIKPKLAKLPHCRSHLASATDRPTCIPQGLTANSYAKKLSKLGSGDGQQWLSQPFTNKDLDTKWLQSETAQMIPAAVIASRTLMWALPIVAVVAGALYILLSDSKLRGLATMSQRIAINALVVCVIAGIAWYFGSNLQLGGLLAGTEASEASRQATVDLLQPLFQRILGDVSRVVALLSGGLAILTGVTWFIARRFSKQHAAQPAGPPVLPPDLQPPPVEPTSAPTPGQPLPEKPDKKTMS